MKQSIFSILLIGIVLAASFAVGYTFKPFTYIDNGSSKIVCNKNNVALDMGWNFIYTFEDKLDSFNDVKARKLCEFNSIKDYANFYKTPSDVNYHFEAKYTQDSSWTDTLLVFNAALFLGILIVRALLRRNLDLKYLALSLIIAPFIFFFLLRKPSAVFFCQRQVARKVNNFKRVIFRYNIFPIPEEEQHIRSVLPQIYKNCLKHEGI